MSDGRRETVQTPEKELRREESGFGSSGGAEWTILVSGVLLPLDVPILLQIPHVFLDEDARELELEMEKQEG